MPKEKYESPNPRRAYTIMSQEEAAAGKKSSWYELEISGEDDVLFTIFRNFLTCIALLYSFDVYDFFLSFLLILEILG